MIKKLTTNEFIARARDIHSDNYDYSKFIYKNYFTHGIIICKKHGEFLQSPSNHISTHNRCGCPKCIGKNKTNDEFIEECNHRHNNLYDYSITKYNGYMGNINIICKKHGKFSQRAGHHLEGHGCKKCGITICRNLKFSNTSEFIIKAKKIYPYFYDYSNVKYKSAKKHVIVKCKKHGNFNVTPDNHLRGRGCPICKSSKGELKIHNFLKRNNIEYRSQKTFANCKNPRTGRKLKFDFYIPSKNFLIEYDGEQHYKIAQFGNYKYTTKDLKELQLKDKIKTMYAITNHIKLLRIKYDKIENIDQILTDEL